MSKAREKNSYDGGKTGSGNKNIKGKAAGGGGTNPMSGGAVVKGVTRKGR